MGVYIAQACFSDACTTANVGQGFALLNKPLYQKHPRHLGASNPSPVKVAIHSF